MKNVFLFLAFLICGSAAHAQPGTVDLKDGTNTVLGSYTSVSTAYAAIPATLANAYIIEMKSGYNGATEVFPIIFTAKSGASATNTITLRPAAGVTAVNMVATTGSASAALKLDDADWVIVDGRPGGTGTTRALTIDQQGTSTSAYGVWLINGATNNVFRWCNFTGYRTASSGIKCIYINTSASNPSGNSNNNFEYLKFTGGRTSINSSGTDANNNNNNRIYGCEFVNTAFAAFWGQGGNGHTTIDSNFFYSTTASGTSSTGTFAMLFDFIGDTVIITRNKIYDFDNSAYTTDVHGIVIRSFDPFPSYTRIVNNFIALNAPNTSSDIVMGIAYGLNSANNPHFADVHHNTVRIGGTSTGGTTGNVNSAAFHFDATNPGSTFNVSNNIFVNERTGGAEQHVGIWYSTTNSTINRSNNTYNVTTGDLARIGTTMYNTMSSYQAAVSGNEAGSNTAPVVFASATDLHLAGTSVGNPALAGAAVPGVTTDIDNAARVVPYRGADETTPPPLCTGTPNIATLTGPAAAPCVNTPFTLSAAGQSTGYGIWYYFQSRPAGSTGPWVTIGAPSTSVTAITTAATSNTEYRFVDSCAGSGLIAPSNVVTITPGPLPVVTFISETHTLLNYSFTANGVQNATGYSWNFGDNTPPGTTANPTHLYASPGTYNVRLIVTNACGADTADLIIAAAGCGTATSQQLFATDTTICPGDTTLLHVVFLNTDTASAPYLTISWEQSPDGVAWLPIVGAANDSLRVFPTDTTWYRYKLTCAISSQSITSNARIIYVLPEVQIAGITETHTVNSYTFTAVSPEAVTGYSWNFGDGSPVINGTAMESHLYALPGTYTVQLVVSGECGTDTATLTITVSFPGSGITTTAAAEGISLFPNPAQSVLTIRSTRGEISGITLLNSTGQVIRRERPGKVKEQTLDIRSLPAGHYLLRLEHAGGRTNLSFNKL